MDSTQPHQKVRNDTMFPGSGKNTKNTANIEQMEEVNKDLMKKYDELSKQPEQNDATKKELYHVRKSWLENEITIKEIKISKTQEEKKKVEDEIDSLDEKK